MGNLPCSRLLSSSRLSVVVTAAADLHVREENVTFLTIDVSKSIATSLIMAVSEKLVGVSF